MPATNNPPHRRVSSSGMKAADILNSETRPAGVTFYAGIDLKVKDKFGSPPAKMTCIYIPDHFSYDDGGVDVILYLHGFKLDDPHISIDKYLKQDYGKLREGLEASGRNAVLVAPTLGFHSEAQGLVAHGGLDGLLGRVLATLRDHGAPKGEELFLRSLIISCHSGGGARMHQLAGGSDDALANLQEFWGFDCMYQDSDTTFWPQWAKQRTSARCYVHFLETTAVHSKVLQQQKLPNLIVRKSTAKTHMLVPTTHWPARLKAAGFLETRQGFVDPTAVPAV